MPSGSSRSRQMPTYSDTWTADDRANRPCAARSLAQRRHRRGRGAVPAPLRQHLRVLPIRARDRAGQPVGLGPRADLHGRNRGLGARGVGPLVPLRRPARATASSAGYPIFLPARGPTRTWSPPVPRRGYTRGVRFAIRQGKLADAEGVARAHTASWRTSYRGILPDAILDRIDVDQRAASWRRVLADPSILTLVAYDTTHHDIVGL